MDPQLLSKPPHAALLELYGALGLATRDGVVFLDMINECLAAADVPFHERNQAARDIEKRFRRTQPAEHPFQGIQLGLARSEGGGLSMWRRYVAPGRPWLPNDFV